MTANMYFEAVAGREALHMRHKYEKLFLAMESSFLWYQLWLLYLQLFG